jgi:uncharacterized lipoprotein YajG
MKKFLFVSLFVPILLCLFLGACTNPQDTEKVTENVAESVVSDAGSSENVAESVVSDAGSSENVTDSEPKETKKD